MVVDSAANSLEGKLLKNKWKVIKKIEQKTGATGGFFSVCYIVNDGTKDAFLKALNFNAFFQLFKGRPVVQILQEQTNAFQYEKKVLELVKNRRLSKVSLILDEGEEYLDEFTISNVPYLIFEMADGDVRSYMDFSKNVDLAWKLKSLHNVAVGLQQLNSVNVGHQDLKPSNILVYENGLLSKIGDLGRSLCLDIVAPHIGDGNFPGDFSYAPPEFLYGFIEPDLKTRIRATDIYLFGSLIVFYFTGVNMTALIGKNIDQNFKWSQWTGTFDEVKDYLIEGFFKALLEFKDSIKDVELANDLCKIVEYCCFPYPDKRGHPKSKTLFGNQYDFQRFISNFDLLSRKALYKFK